MLKHAVLLILCLSCSAFAQTREPDEYYSHVTVVLGGYACTVINHGIVQSVGGPGPYQYDDGSRWDLPETIVLPSHNGTPCSSKGTPTRERTTVTVTATAELPGAITAKAGTVNLIHNDTAGWLSVTNTTPATPGLSLDEQCQRAIHGSDRLLSYYAGEPEVQKLIPIITAGGIDVYTNDKEFTEAVQAREFNGSFSATVFFVFRDEAVRQLAIQAIAKNNPHAKADDLKYVVMNVGYSPTFLDPHILRPNGDAVAGPILAVGSSDYIVPVRCTTSSLYRDFQNKAGNVELIVTPGPTTTVPTLLGSEGGFIDACTNCTRWSLLAGDLTPLRTVAGFGVIRLNEQGTPFLMQVVEAMDKRIAAARSNEGDKSGYLVGGGSGNPRRIGGGVSAPQLIYSVEPKVTKEARKAKIGGSVLVNCWVEPTGLPSHVHVIRGVGMGLDDKAVEAVRQYRFNPAMENGKPVLVELNIEVNFLN
jgi:TonB family protein